MYPMNPLQCMVTVGHNARAVVSIRRPTEQEETAIRGRYATQRVVLTPGREQATTGVSLTDLTERLHSEVAIPPGRKCFLLIQG
jgi:hypothetical protein